MLYTCPVFTHCGNKDRTTNVMEADHKPDLKLSGPLADSRTHKMSLNSSDDPPGTLPWWDRLTEDDPLPLRQWGQACKNDRD
jgi:hypothetical protein